MTRTPSPPPIQYSSPKRKRTSLDTDPTISLSPSSSRLRTSLSPSKHPGPGGDSPRTAITGQLEALDITAGSQLPPKPHSELFTQTREGTPSDSLDLEESTVPTIASSLPIQNKHPSHQPPQKLSRAVSPPPEAYGLNGIGFRPTPALAYARAQTRKKQVAGWKSREAREARQRRSERRGQGGGIGLGSGGGNDGGGMEAMQEQRRRVRFVEG